MLPGNTRETWCRDPASAFHADGAAVSSYDAMNDRQTQAGTLTDLLGRKEGFEDALDDSGVDADA